MDAIETLIIGGLTVWAVAATYKRSRDYKTLEKQLENQNLLTRAKRIEASKWLNKYNAEVVEHRKTDRELVDVKQRLATFNKIAKEESIIVHRDNFKKWQFRYVADEIESTYSDEQIAKRARRDLSNVFAELFKYEVETINGYHGVEKFVEIKFGIIQLENGN